MSNLVDVLVVIFLELRPHLAVVHESLDVASVAVDTHEDLHNVQGLQSLVGVKC